MENEPRVYPLIADRMDANGLFLGWMYFKERPS